MHYYQHNIGDFDKATRHLTRLERSIYRDLIELYYDSEYQLNLSVKYLCRKILANSNEESTTVEQVLNEFFTETPDGWYHERCEEEIYKFKNSKSQKSEAGRASAAVRQQKRQQALNGNPTVVEQTCNGAPTIHKPITIKQETITIKENSEKSARFSPPTINEVDQYMAEICKGSYQEAEKFVDYYESKGWLVGKTKMKAWKASVRNWVKNKFDTPAGKSKGCNADQAKTFLEEFSR